ncbi:preprotein translocase subunit SecY [Polluticoccus soli]|uniref:preprotein translocase subunit SecY n=1 Tax=Polluticoccus soli TaxID=3034150 RepID=UPI0023E1ECA4|nr:preprotein translocase subunit SecY [Flavipsychrobacter sp. JY13-12]
MKKLIETLKNIWSIEELRKRILFTILLVAIYRIGCYITLPGINPNLLALEGSKEGLLGLFNMFAGGAFSRASIFALGVMPYISASIFMQLAGIVIPQIAKMQREDSGRKKINQYTRYLTVLVTAFQASAYVAYLRTQTAGAIVAEFPPFLFWLSTVVVLTAGTLFVMWMGEKITDKGIGNGVSLIIMVGILGRLPESLLQEFAARNLGGGGGLLIFLVELAVFIAVIVGLILLTQGVRKIPLNYARRIIGSTNAAKEVSGARDFIPLKVNSAGVMPIIFAQAIMFIPATIVGFAQNETAQGFVKAMSNPQNLWYNVVYAVLVIAFTYFYTALIFNPTEMADNLKRNNSFIPGVKPGEPTADYIGTIMDRITLPGAVFLAIAGIMPGIAGLLGITSGFASFFGGTSMLIGVGVILDTLQQIESHLLMRQYDGLMKTGRITGRQATASV